MSAISVPDAQPIPETGYVPSTTLGQVLIDALGTVMTLHLAWFLDGGVGSFADEMYQLMTGSGTDDGNTPTVGTYLNGELVQPGDGYDPPYASALDPSRASAGYGYLGNFVGVQVPAGTDDATAQSLVTAEQGMQRGTNSAMISAAQRFLTGSQFVQIIERTYVDGTPCAGWFLMIVRPEEITDADALIDAVNAVKFDGIGWTLVQQDQWLIEDLEAAYATIADVEAAYSTITDLETQGFTNA